MSRGRGSRWAMKDKKNIGAWVEGRGDEWQSVFVQLRCDKMANGKWPKSVRRRGLQRSQDLQCDFSKAKFVRAEIKGNQRKSRGARKIFPKVSREVRTSLRKLRWVSQTCRRRFGSFTP